jgi:hypothetical protein
VSKIPTIKDNAELQKEFNHNIKFFNDCITKKLLDPNAYIKYKSESNTSRMRVIAYTCGFALLLFVQFYFNFLHFINLKLTSNDNSTI